MTGLTEEQREDLGERLDNILAQLVERPHDLVLHAGLVYTAGLLGRHEIMLEQCAELFYSDPTNTAYFKIFTLVLEQNISDGRFDLVIKHKERFYGLKDFLEDYLEKLEIACDKQEKESDTLSCKEKLVETIFLYEKLIDILDNPNLRLKNNTSPEPL